MADPCNNKKDASIKASKRTNHLREISSSASTVADGTSSETASGTEPGTHAFLETLFGILLTDIVILKKDIDAEINGHTREVNEMGEQVANLELTSDAPAEELDAHHCELLELQDKHAELHYQVEDLDNRCQRTNIRIKGVLLRAAVGDLEDGVFRLFHHVGPELACRKSC
ncbi:hypothetical protein NDU88_007787 [Pleurodeles waltl]|uniref:Uncharacterized protein n=1 Tax=Pleurodeles waltl TaxID=8319 RepID=A0AAV7PMA4_PLEWA|nr:hypothetical protein NDU88_007787 [Pleurodeles waltl]